MNRRALAIVALTGFLLACDPLARTELTLSFDETGETVAVHIVSDENRLRVVRATMGDRIGEEILAGRDEWSIRLANAGATEEQIVLNRSRREVKRVEHRSVIAARDLQAFFFDVGATVQMTRGEGWAELTIYPGASTRASRQQRESLQRKLETYSLRAVRYFDAVRVLYGYMDNNPQRAEDLFTALYSESADDQPVLSESEADLLAAVKRAVDALGQDQGEESERELGILADLVYNPFPAVIKVVLPSEPLLLEGFDHHERTLVISTPMPSHAIWQLEGRWIRPDPAAAAMRAGEVQPRQLAAQLAATERRAAAVVSPFEVMNAVVEQLKPAKQYRVRWITKSAPPDPPGAPRAHTPVLRPPTLSVLSAAPLVVSSQHSALSTGGKCGRSTGRAGGGAL